MKAEKIELMRDWPELMSVCNIQVFLGFPNFYWQFIQNFNRIIAPLISILKMTGSPDKPAPNRNNGSRSASNKNNNSRPALGKNDGNDKFDKFGGDDVEYAKKLGKLKGQKLAKSQKLSKLRKSQGKKSKKLSQNGNLPNFNATEARPSFSTPNTRTVFKCL